MINVKKICCLLSANQTCRNEFSNYLLQKTQALSYICHFSKYTGCSCDEVVDFLQLHQKLADGAA